MLVTVYLKKLFDLIILIEIHWKYSFMIMGYRSIALVFTYNVLRYIIITL